MRPPSSPGRALALRWNALANIGGRSASALVWVALTPWMLGLMGIERFGLWSLFFALSGSLALVDFGLAPAVTRFVAVHAAQGEGRAMREVVARGRSASLLLAAVWFSAGLLLGPLLCRVFHVPAPMEAEARRAIACFGAALAALSIGQNWQGALAGVQRLDLANLAWLSGLAVHATLLVVLLARGTGLVGAGIAALGGNVCSALVSWWTFEQCARHVPDGGPGRGTGWSLLGGYGGTVQLTNLLIFTQMQGGRALLGALGGLAAVTVFELAFRAANTLWSFSVLMQGALVPAAAARQAAGAADGLRELYRWGLRWMNVLAAAALCAAWAMGGPLMRAWLGEGARIDVGVLRALAAGLLLTTPALAGAAIARGAGRPLLETQYFAVALALQVAAAFLLVPRFGAAGAAYALAGSLALSAVVTALRVHRWLGLRSLTVFFREILPRWAPGVAAAAIVVVVLRPALPDGRTEAVAAFSGQAALYVAALFSFGLLSGDTQPLVRRVRRALAA